MPPSSQPVNVSRKLLWLALSVFAICVLYSAAWFIGVSKGHDWLERRLSNFGDSMSATCPGMDIKGFPFRIGVFCTSATLTNPINHINISTGAVRTMALVYNPGKAVFEIDGPAQASLPDATTVTSNWSNLDGSLGAGLSGLKHLSVAIDKASAEIISAILPGPMTIATGHGEFHARQNGDNLDIAALAENNTASTSLLPQQLPLFSISIDATLDKLAGLLEAKALQPGTEINGTIHRLALDFGNDGFLTLSGPFSIAADGYLSGDFDLSAENFEALRSTLKASFPQASPTIDVSAILMKSLSKDGTNATVRLNVRAGTILLGVIPVGFIPPL
jgi:hypothetical protein